MIFSQFGDLRSSGIRLRIVYIIELCSAKCEKEKSNIESTNSLFIYIFTAQFNLIHLFHNIRIEH